MDYQLELDRSPGRAQTEESLTVTWEDGSVERMRLHEYERVYSIPGLYEEVVQNRLQCDSPRKLAESLIGSAARYGFTPPDLRVFDLGAGNGVVGEELRGLGVRTMVGSDNIAEARDAALRDRPDVYAEYLVGDVNELSDVGDVVRRHELNAIVCAGALGLGHITADSFDRLWSDFPPGALFAVSVGEALARPGGSDFGDYLERLEAGDEGEILLRERFRHRLTMAGKPLYYEAVVARRA